MNILVSRPRTSAETMFVDSFHNQMSMLPGNADVIRARDAALEIFKSGGFPSRRVESWHYTDIRTLLRSVVPFNTSVETQSIAPFIAGSMVATISNGLSISAHNIEGVLFERLSHKLTNGSFVPALVTGSADDTIGQINTAYVSDGWCVDIADDVILDIPLELQNLQQSGQSHVRFPVRVGMRAKVTIIERQNSAQGESFSSSITHLTVEDDAEITWIILREYEKTSVQLCQFNAWLGKNAKLTLYVVNSGGKLIRQEVHVLAKGEGSNFQLRGINLLSDDSHTDITMTIDHLVKNTTSTEIVRNVVTGRARGVFQGMIRVAKAAQKTDARMACNTLLLSDDGEFDAKPELEIFADDVACGHGATVTEINQDYLFYFMARGIPEKIARGLLVKAFIAETIEELDNEQLIGMLENMLKNWLSKHILNVSVL